jgi:hypothetical protein
MHHLEVVLGSVVVAVGEDRGEEVGALFFKTGSEGTVEDRLTHLEVIFDFVVFLYHLKGRVLDFNHLINLFYFLYNVNRYNRMFRVVRYSV